MVSVKWFGEFSAQTVTWETMFGIKRNGSPVGYNTQNTGTSAFGTSMASLSYYGGNDGASTPEMCSFEYLDSPNTSASITYQVYANSNIASTLYTNRTVGGSGEFGISTITLWEIAQ